MKFEIDDKETGTLRARIGMLNEEYVIKGLDLDKIYQWYPMNVGYTLRYQKTRERLYLYPLDNPAPVPDYNYPSRERYKPEEITIKKFTPDMVCENVMKDNVELCILADSLGLPHMLKSYYSNYQVKKAIKHVLSLQAEVKEYLLNRLIDSEGFSEDYHNLEREEQDKLIYEQASTEEQYQISTFGKLYTMLNLMRKISEVREKAEVEA